MANDDIIARFRLDIEGLNKDINKIKDKLGSVNKEASKSAQGLSTQLGKVGGLMASVFAVDRIISFGKSIINVTAQMEKFKAVLTNTLGSASQAQTELDKIAKFAAKTPLTIAEITENFIKLTNRGVKPTIAQLQAFGDLALSLGKDLTQVTEAVLDINNPERWKELGIQAQTNGDKVKLTFRGVSHEVDRTVKGVSDAVVAFGQMEGVIGGMDKAAETLGGKISTLSDSWDQLKLSIGNSSSEIVTGFIDLLTKGLDRMTEGMDAVSAFMKEFGEDAQKTRDAEIEVFFKELAHNIKGSKYEAEDLKDELTIINEELGKVEERQKKAQKIFNIAKLADPFNKLNVKGAAAQVLYEVNQEYTTMLEIYNRLKGVAEGTLTWEEAMGKIKKENNNEDRNTNEVIKTRRQILEELIKKEEYILQLKVGQGKVTEKEQGNIFKYKNELDSIVNEEEKRLKIVSDLLDLKNEEKRLNEAEKNDLEEVNKLLMAKGVLTDDSASKPSARNNEMENQLADNIIDSTQQAARTYAEYVDYLNAQDERRIKALQEFNDKEISLLNDKYNQGLISYEDYTRAVADQQAFADEQRKQLMAKQLQREKVAATFTAVTESAQAILRALNTKPPFNFILAGLVAAQTAIQVSAINSAQVPQFEKGGYIKGKRHKEGGVLIEAEGGEYMVNRQGTARHLEVIEAINNGYFDKLIYQDWVLPALEQQKKEFSKMKDKSFASNLAESLVVKAMIDEDRLINSDKNTRKILMSIDSKLGRNSYINKRNA